MINAFFGKLLTRYFPKTPCSAMSAFPLWKNRALKDDRTPLRRRNALRYWCSLLYVSCLWCDISLVLYEWVTGACCSRGFVFVVLCCCASPLFSVCYSWCSLDIVSNVFIYEYVERSNFRVSFSYRIEDVLLSIPWRPRFFFLTIGFDDYRNRLPEGTGIIYRFDFRFSASYISSSILIRYGTRLCYWCPCISLCVHVRVCAAPLLKEQMSCVSLAGCLV